jgi:hypothetical protein
MNIHNEIEDILNDIDEYLGHLGPEINKVASDKIEELLDSGEEIFVEYFTKMKMNNCDNNISEKYLIGAYIASLKNAYEKNRKPNINKINDDLHETFTELVFEIPLVYELNKSSF